MDLKQASKIVSKLLDAYDQSRYTKPEEKMKKTDLFCVYFADIPYRIVDRVVDEWIRSHREAPTIAEILSRSKDALILETSPKFTEDIKPTWWYILEARGVDMEAPVKPEIRAMTDKLVEAMRRDPRMRARYEAEMRKKKQDEDDDGSEPFEI